MTKAHERQLAEYARANADLAAENNHLQEYAEGYRCERLKLLNQITFANTAANEYRRSIEQFKAEAAQQAINMAEASGYISRTLEDDRVREQPKIESAPDSTTTVRFDRQYSEPLRRGPVCFAGQPYHNAACSVSSNGCDSDRPAPAPVKPWHSR